jgi:hypothetical protein
MIFRGPIGALDPLPLAVSVQWDPLDLVFAPDGASLAFLSRVKGTLMRMPLTGGAAVPIGRTEPPFGMSWDADGIVIGQGPGGVLRFHVSNASVPAEQLVQVDEDEIAAAPQMLLPDGRLLTMAPAPTAIRGTATPELQVVLNWFDELQQLVPAR